MKVAQRERGSDEPKISLVAPSYGQNVFFVGWVPNRQDRSPTDEMACSAPRNGHISGPRDTWDPKQGSPGPHLAENGPQYRENSAFWRFCPVSGPKRGCESSLSPPDPPKPVNRELRPQEAEPLEVAVAQKLRNAYAFPMGQNFPENSLVAPSYGQKPALEGGGGGGGGSTHAAPPPPKPNQWCKPIGT